MHKCMPLVLVKKDTQGDKKHFQYSVILFKIKIFVYINNIHFVNNTKD